MGEPWDPWQVKEWGGSFQRLEDWNFSRESQERFFVLRQEFRVIWSKETLLLWLRRPADVVSGAMPAVNLKVCYVLHFRDL